MSRILFYDPSCPAPYSARSLLEGALGGTEATVTRIAEAIDARVMQHNRVTAEGRYVPPTSLNDVEHLVVLRDPRPMGELRKQFPRAKMYLWLHDLIRPGSKRGRRIAATAWRLRELGAEIVCVSDFQRRNVEAVLRGAGASRVRVHRIYNPVDDGLVPEASPVDPTKLVFFSSPNKGLSYTLDAFQAVREQLPDLRLHVGNPGYKQLKRAGVQGVEWLGALPHTRILAEVRTALCVFYPNFVLPETFGLVLAEANAVGTPVLTHDCGAAAEVLADSRQVLPVTRAQRSYERWSRFVPSAYRPAYTAWGARRGVFAPYAERLLAWRQGERPRTGPHAHFRLSVVANEWRALFAGHVLSGDGASSGRPSAGAGEAAAPAS